MLADDALAFDIRPSKIWFETFTDASTSVGLGCGRCGEGDLNGLSWLLCLAEQRDHRPPEYDPEQHTNCRQYKDGSATSPSAPGLVFDGLRATISMDVAFMCVGGCGSICV